MCKRISVVKNVKSIFDKDMLECLYSHALMREEEHCDKDEPYSCWRRFVGYRKVLNKNPDR